MLMSVSGKKHLIQVNYSWISIDMNLEEDDECTCDIGPFATCPACERARISTKTAADIAEDERISKYWQRKKNREDAAKLTPMDYYNYGKMSK